MTLFSWFIKTNKNSASTKRLSKGVLTTAELKNTHTEVQATILANELNTFNNNTMWPIAKVKTATMIIKKPKESSYQTVAKKSKAKKAKNISTNLVSIPLGH
jgi:hypothetical protein